MLPRPTKKGGRTISQISEEAVRIALERFDPKQHTTSKDCWNLIMESLADVLGRDLVPSQTEAGETRSP